MAIEERWYDRKSARLREGEPALLDIEAEIWRLAKSLRRGHRDQPEHQNNRLADLLEACRPNRRCLTAACLQCSAALQRRLIHRAKRRFAGSSVSLVTIVPTEAVVQIGELQTFQIAEHREHFRTFLRDLGFRNFTVYGGLDISLNVSSDGEWESHWCPHWCLLVSGPSADELRQALKGAIEPTELVMRPTMVRQVTSRRPYVFSYALKSTFFRRTTYRDANGRLCRSRPQALPPRHRNELLVALAEVRVTRRVIYLTDEV